MSRATHAALRGGQEIVREVRVTQSPNGVCYATLGEITLPMAELERMVAAVPRTIAAALDRAAFYFVPLALAEGDQTMVAEQYDSNLVDEAVCHRTMDAGNARCVFISTRLLEDKFSVAFEFYINIGHLFVEKAGLSSEFADLVWKQASAGVRGETGLDAFEFRKQAFSDGATDEKARLNYANAAFSDAVAIYLLSLCLDVDYYELREREYPLLAPSAMAERLKKVAALFPHEPGFPFNIFYRRRP